MTTAEANTMVQKFGMNINASSFLECIESMDVLNHYGLLAEPFREAYKITIDEMAALAGVGE
jgi:hypothetical protein